MSTSPITSSTDQPAPKFGDKIKMRGPDGVEREGTFLGSLYSLATNDGKTPVEQLKISDDLSMTRQGALYRVDGADAGQLTWGAHTVLMSAFDAGADVAADYLKGHNAGSDHALYKDQSLTMGQMRALSEHQRSPETGEPTTEEPTAADELLKILQQHIQPKFDYHVAAGERYAGTGEDDAIAAAAGANVSSYEGDDWIDGRENLTANGGLGNDVIEAYDNAKLVGGRGDDKLTAYNHSALDGGAGNDHLGAGSHARISGGDGHDYISAYSNSFVDGGTGNDYIGVYSDSTVTGGEGHDFIMADDRVTLDGGVGNDIIRARDAATITGGQGDDTIRVGKNVVIHFNRGDGADTIETVGGPIGVQIAQMMGRSIDVLSSARVVLSQDIRPADISVTRDGADLRIGIAGGPDSLLVRNFEQRGTPSLVFADGSVLSGTVLKAQAGPGLAA